MSESKQPMTWFVMFIIMVMVNSILIVYLFSQVIARTDDRFTGTDGKELKKYIDYELDTFKKEEAYMHGLIKPECLKDHKHQ